MNRKIYWVLILSKDKTWSNPIKNWILKFVTVKTTKTSDNAKHEVRRGRWRSCFPSAWDFKHFDLQGFPCKKIKQKKSQTQHKLSHQIVPMTSDMSRLETPKCASKLRIYFVFLISYIKIFPKKTGKKWSNNKFESHQTKHLRFFVTNFSEFHSSQLLLPAGAGWVGSFFCFCRRASKTLRALSARLRSVSGVPRVVEIFGEFMRYTGALETNSQLGSLERFSRELSRFLAHFQSFAAIFRECKYMYLPKLVDFWWLLSFNISGHEKFL